MSHEPAHLFQSTNRAIPRERLLAGEVSSYDAVAEEYYEPALHPTCAAFGKLSQYLLSRGLDDQNLRGLVVCEVGAGRSAVARVLGDRISELGSMWIVDSSERMIRWSDCFEHPNIERCILNSESIDQLGVKFDLIVASLGDPFNTVSFWRSVAHSLKGDGVCLFTTPSYEWAAEFRTSTADEVDDRALFVFSDGSRHYFPSFVYSAHVQAQLLEACSLEVRSIATASVDILEEIPPKLAFLTRNAPVVTMYLIGNRKSLLAV